jgi:hypothetical protein
MTRVESMQRSLIVLGCLGCVAYFAIWACAPVQHMRPPVPIAQSGESEYGVAVGALNQIYVQREAPSPTGMAWWQWANSDGSMRYGTALSFNGSLPGLTGYLGMRLNETPSSYIWLDGGLTLIGAELSLPMGLALTDTTWLYSAPGVTLGATGLQTGEGGLLRIPIGLAYWSPSGDFSFRFEAGVLTHDLADRGRETHLFAGIGIAIPIKAKSAKD